MKRAKLLWMDLEMTGLDPEMDRILEVAIIGTDWKFNEVFRYTAVVKVPEELMKKRMVGEFWEKNNEARDELMKQNEIGKSASEVEDEILELIDEKCSKEVYLAGNSIHQDRKFIDKEWKRLSNMLHYRMMDVSAWKIYFEGARKKYFAKPEAHRALDDIEGSIEELKFYLKEVGIEN